MSPTWTRLKRGLSTLALAALAVAIGGCDLPELGSSDDEAALKEVIVRDLTTADPTDCFVLETQRFVEQNTGKKGEAALEECHDSEADTSDEVLADDVQVSDVAIDGDTGHARALVSGGALNGVTVDVDLVRNGVRWKLDRVTDVAIDRPAWEGTMGPLLRQRGFAASDAACMVRRIHKIPTGKLERMLIQSDSAGFEKAATACVSPDSFRRQIVKEIQSTAHEQSLPASVARCIVSRVNRRVSDEELRSSLTDEKTQQALRDQVSDIARGCAASG